MAPEPDKNTPPAQPPAQAPPTQSTPAPQPPIQTPPIQTPPTPPQDDPLVVEYAEDLKKSLGDLYEKEYDKLPLKERIQTMKVIKKTMDKLPHRGEGNVPNAPDPEGVVQKTKGHCERWKAGERDFHKSSVFGIKANK